MKAILVIDMPSCCHTCRLEHYGLCMGTLERKTIASDSTMPNYCPLKPMDDYILCKRKQEVVERFPNGKVIAKEVYEPIGETEW